MRNNNSQLTIFNQDSFNSIAQQ